MIKELDDYFKENGFDFFQDDELFNKYFRERKLTKKERKKTNEVNDKVEAFLKKTDVKNPGYSYVSYLEGLGYYEISYADRGHYNIIPLGEDADIIFMRTVNDILFTHYSNIEAKNREVVEYEYHMRFGDIEYDWLLYPREMSLYKWREYYDGNLPKEIIEAYEKKVNGIWWNEEYNIYFKYNGREFVLDKQRMLKLDKQHDDSVIKELGTGNLRLSKDSELYKKYFEKYWELDSKDEAGPNKSRQLFQKKKRFINKAIEQIDYHDANNEFWYFTLTPIVTYLDDYGFYERKEEDDIINITPLGEDVDFVFDYSMKTFLHNLAIHYEERFRNQIMEEMRNRFGDVDYELLKDIYICEFALEKWNKYYDGMIPEELIQYYENNLNELWFNIKSNTYYKYDGNKFVLDEQRMILKKDGK